MARTVEIEPLLAAIEALQDDDLVLELYEILGLTINGHPIKPSAEELAEMELAEDEIDRGEFISHEEVMAKAKASPE